MSQLTLDSEQKSIPIKRKNPSKDLHPVELKLYNYLRKIGPRTEIEIRRNPAFDTVSDIGRALRRLRSHDPPYVEARAQREGPQKWEAVL